MASQTKIETDPKEEKFRNDTRWLSFKAATWGAVGMATFFGALSTIAMGVVSIATGVPASVAGGIPTASAALLGGVVPLMAIGGLLAFGAFAIYMSEHNRTELNVMSSAHQAEQTAKCMGQGPAPSIEHEQNCRIDGKKWGDLVANENKPAYSASR